MESLNIPVKDSLKEFLLPFFSIMWLDLGCYLLTAYTSSVVAGGAVLSALQLFPEFSHYCEVTRSQETILPI